MLVKLLRQFQLWRAYMHAREDKKAGQRALVTLNELSQNLDFACKKLEYFEAEELRARKALMGGVFG